MVKDIILNLYDYPELVVPNINDICCCACYGNRFSDKKRPVHMLIYILNHMEDKELFGFADDLYYWKSKMAYRDRKPSLISWLQDDVADNINCSKRLKKYLKYRGGYTYKLLDKSLGDEAGIKSITFQVNGENAYGYLKSERGVHRLVRISPFNAAGKRQTSFVSCDVMPEINDEIDIEIKDEDIRIDTYRSSGAGGQHINKTSSAIRITHFPTGIVVTCQNERSQHMNKDKAMQMLKAKLYLLKQEENAKKAADIRGEVTDNGWGSQIRSYVMQPYTMVKDHRTNVEVGNVDSVMDGNIDPFINGYLKWISLGENEAQ